MSNILETGNNRQKCQKFTPDELVRTMLDISGYRKDVFGKKILENSFGSGCILKKIVKTYIEESIIHGLSNYRIARGLEQDIFGIELDESLFCKCLDDLNQITNYYGIPHVSWNVYNENALEFDFKTSFDYIIGNPPYISYKEIDIESRNQIRSRFNTCRYGKFDYCYAFIELGVSLLSPKGKLVQLVPNNIYKNVFAQELRNYLSEHISVIYDYPEQQLFAETLTSISIFLYDKAAAKDEIDYRNMTSGDEIRISRLNLNNKWVFSQERNNSKLRFGDFFKASISIATLLNEAFVLDQEMVDNERIETEVIKKAASPKSKKGNKVQRIIFPYIIKGKTIEHYTVTQFEALFPHAVKHLKKYETKLRLRDCDKNALWFEYGRSQAIERVNCKKLLMSTIITSKAEIYDLSEDEIPYSGIYIRPVTDILSLEQARKILCGNKFLQYAKRIGIKVSGKSVRITCKDINEFRFNLED